MTGRVQGVGFRWATAAEARRLGTTGWARNRSDGTVEVHVEGDAAAVERLVDWLHHGPETAAVTSVSVEPVVVEGMAGFDVR